MSFRGNYIVPASFLLGMLMLPQEMKAFPNCEDNPKYKTKVGISCAHHSDVDCYSMATLFRFNPAEMDDLLDNCPDSCGLCTNTPSLLPSVAPTGAPTLTCHDTPAYRDRYGSVCQHYDGLACQKMSILGFTQKEVLSLMQSCPRSCGMCTAAPSNIPSYTPSFLPTSLPSNVPSMKPSATPSFQPTTSPSTTPSSIPSSTPSAFPSMIPSSTPSSVPTSKTPSSAPTTHPTNYPTQYPTFGPTNFPTAYPTFYPTYSPTDKPSYIPSFSPSRAPISSPSFRPTDLPSSVPSFYPTNFPTQTPTFFPTWSPTWSPTFAPTYSPSSRPSNVPSFRPSAIPSEYPSSIPSLQPSTFPSLRPSYVPSRSQIPSDVPSDLPSVTPSSSPTHAPSKLPSAHPSMLPSYLPSKYPTLFPSSEPSMPPSKRPSWVPSMTPSRSPSNVPSDVPSTVPTASPRIVPISPFELKMSQVYRQLNGEYLDAFNDVVDRYLYEALTTLPMMNNKISFRTELIAQDLKADGELTISIEKTVVVNREHDNAFSNSILTTVSLDSFSKSFFEDSYLTSLITSELSEGDPYMFGELDRLSFIRFLRFVSTTTPQKNTSPQELIQETAGMPMSLFFGGVASAVLLIVIIVGMFIFSRARNINSDILVEEHYASSNSPNRRPQRKKSRIKERKKVKKQKSEHSEMIVENISEEQEQNSEVAAATEGLTQITLNPSTDGNIFSSAQDGGIDMMGCSTETDTLQGDMTVMDSIAPNSPSNFLSKFQPKLPKLENKYSQSTMGGDPSIFSVNGMSSMEPDIESIQNVPTDNKNGFVNKSISKHDGLGNSSLTENTSFRKSMVSKASSGEKKDVKQNNSVSRQVSRSPIPIGGMKPPRPFVSSPNPTDGRRSSRPASASGIESPIPIKHRTMSSRSIGSRLDSSINPLTKRSSFSKINSSIGMSKARSHLSGQTSQHSNETEDANNRSGMFPRSRTDDGSRHQKMLRAQRSLSPATNGNQKQKNGTITRDYTERSSNVTERKGSGDLSHVSHHSTRNKKGGGTSRHDPGSKSSKYHKSNQNTGISTNSLIYQEAACKGWNCGNVDGTKQIADLRRMKEKSDRVHSSKRPSSRGARSRSRQSATEDRSLTDEDNAIEVFLGFGESELPKIGRDKSVEQL